MIESKKTKCSECCFCKLRGRADAKYAGVGHTGYARGYFYCTNPAAQELKDKHGYPQNAFIGYGSPESDTKLQLKTRPRWCPLSATE